MDMRNINYIVLTRARVNFSQPETSSLLRGGGGFKILFITGWGGGGGHRKDPGRQFLV